jgi:hypothetical protein
MGAQIVRTRFFVAVEGESEQSFIAWLQRLSESELHIHLDVFLLRGGGFKSMLESAAHHHKRRSITSGAYKDRFLVVDGDRAEQGDWPIEKLRIEASKHKFTVCVQNPNHEALLLRMMPGMEHEIPDAASAGTRLKRQWENYQKPVNANTLERKFSLADLLRVASADTDLRAFLERIGLMGGQ